MDAIFTLREECGGVAQGSGIEPLIFLLCINYLAGLLSGNVLMFADVVKLIYLRSGLVSLKYRLFISRTRSAKNQLPLNASKSIPISIWHQR